MLLLLFACTTFAFSSVNFSLCQCDVSIFIPVLHTPNCHIDLLLSTTEYILVGFEVPMPLGGCNGVGFKEGSNPFFQKTTQKGGIAKDVT